MDIIIHWLIVAPYAMSALRMGPKNRSFNGTDSGTDDEVHRWLDIGSSYIFEHQEIVAAVVESSLVVRIDVRRQLINL